MNHPQAIIFDLDDTLLDDSSQVEACWQEACGEAAARLAGLDQVALRAAIKQEADWYWSDPDRHREGRLDLRAATAGIVARALSAMGIDRPDLARETSDCYRDLRDERLCLVEGAIETIEWFRSRGVRLGMATNGSAAGQGAKIERFRLAPYFDRIIVEGEFGAGKPNREVYEALFTTLGAEPAKTWSVGDNLEWDVGAPQSFGAYGIWVDVRRGGLADDSPIRPDRIVQSVRELIER
ncbi:MAG TPA: HAD family hydrolase [Dehalococcoidia bacterium]|nr:HAD family hydrolase [Dehalococcoidia bacterium]